MRLSRCAVGVLGLTLLTGCRRESATSVFIDPALATLVPAESNVLAGIRMDDVRAAPVYRKWFAHRRLPGLDQFAEQTGIDPRKDLWEVLVAAGPNGSVMMARGKFAEQGQEPKLKREGATTSSYKGYTLTGDEDGVVSFMNPSTALAGRPEVVKSVIDQRNGSPGDAARLLLDKAKSIPRGTPIWMVSTGGIGGREIPQNGNLANLGNLSGLVQSATAVINLGTGVKADINSMCRTEEDAKKLDGTVRALIGMARMLAPRNRPGFPALFEAIKVEQQQRGVRISAEFPEQSLDALFSSPAEARPPQAR